MKAKTLVPSAVALGLFSYFLFFTASHQNIGRLWDVVRNDWFLALPLAITYLLGRLYVWEELLREEKVRISPLKILAAFSVGEAAKILPMGIYLESFILNRSGKLKKKEQVDSYMATTAMLVFESILAIPLVFIIRIPNPWVKWVVSIGIIVWVILLTALYVLTNKVLRRIVRWKWNQLFSRQIEIFLREGRKLLKWQSLILFIPTAVYMLSYAMALYLICRSLGIPLRPEEAVAVFAFFLLATIFIPIPTELGIVEISGLSAMIAFGVEKNLAALAMLSLRVLFGGTVIIISGLAAIFLRREFV